MNQTDIEKDVELLKRMFYAVALDTEKKRARLERLRAFETTLVGVSLAD